MKWEAFFLVKVVTDGEKERMLRTADCACNDPPSPGNKAHENLCIVDNMFALA